MATKKWDHDDPEIDVLKARFTVWLDITLSRASARYKRSASDKLREETDVLSTEVFPIDFFPDPRDPYIDIFRDPWDFDFEEERLAKAFAELPLMRREVLRLIFVEQRKSSEIAKILRCSEAYVRVQKKRAIEKLRKLLEEGSDQADEEE